MRKRERKREREGGRKREREREYFPYSEGDASRYPERVSELVLRGIFMLRRWELLWFYQVPAHSYTQSHQMLTQTHILVQKQTQTRTPTNTQIHTHIYITPVSLISFSYQIRKVPVACFPTLGRNILLRSPRSSVTTSYPHTTAVSRPMIQRFSRTFYHILIFFKEWIGY